MAKESPPPDLPPYVIEYINLIARRMRYTRAAATEVRQELTDHFADALADCPDDEDRQKCAERLIAEFGDAHLLATLIRRGKKRNRPAWKTAFLRVSQGLALLIVLLLIYTTWFVMGQPTVSTDYVALMSQRLHPKVETDQNAWPHYRQATILYAEPESVPLPPGQHTPSGIDRVFPKAWQDTDLDLAHAPPAVQQAVRHHIQKNEAAWGEFVAASREPYCWYEYSELDDLAREMAATRRTPQPATPTSQPDDSIWKGSVMAILLLPNMAPLRGLAKIAVWKSRLAEGLEDPHQAMARALVSARVSRHWVDPDRLLIEQLVGQRICTMSCQEIRRLSADRAMSTDDLQSVQQQLESLYARGFPLLGVATERMSFADAVQRLFTDSGPGGGHLIPKRVEKAWELIGPEPGPSTSIFGTPIPYIPLLSTGMSLVHAGRDDTLAMANAYYDRVEQWCRLAPYQREDKPSPDRMTMKLSRERYWVLRMFLPSLSRAADLTFVARAEYDATLTVLATRRYDLDKGEYPAKLDVLVKDGYLKALPIDPYSGDPLVYRRTAGGFTLYSVAGNFQDDGGVANPDKPWDHRDYDADYVFWPVPPLRPFPADDEAS